ncbi:MAG: tetratricopeptide repeat protein [Proteobacteria bacterium]|nr:tetratricopeptide repeat protein [Pseudomonadota bacterium]
MFSFAPLRAYRIARALYQQGRLEDAEEVYQRILTVMPDDALAHHDIGVVQFERGQVYQGVERVKLALTRDSTRVAFFATMAGMLEDPAYQAYLRSPFYGPFNAQQMRQRIFRGMIELADPRSIFETGTFRGTTTEFIARATTAHVFTCEIDVNYFAFATQRLRELANVTVVHLDSRSFLKRYVPLFARGDAACLFYLDAHWDKEDLPLIEELGIVFAQVPRAVVMIDDFEVWDDPGYSFDDYGPGRRLGLPYLAPLARFAPRYFFPANSSGETGVRRGSVVIATDPALAARIARIPELRPAPMPPAL